MMNVALSEKMTQFLQHFKTPENGVQKAAFEQLQEMDFPTTRDEYWKYTRVGKITNNAFSLAQAGQENYDLSDYLMSPNFMVVENGILREDLSNYKDTTFDVSILNSENIGQAFENSRINPEDVFNVSNTALISSAIKLTARKNEQIETPLQIIYIGNGEKTVAYNRLLVSAEKFSKSEIVVTYINTDNNTTLINSVSEVYVEENAHFVINKIQACNASNLAVCTEQIRQENNSNFKINTITLNGLLQRNNINIEVVGQNCETHMNGAIVTKGNQHVDNHTFVDHQVSNCFSNENYKYVLDGKSTGVFNGRVVVQPDAQIINAYQKNGNILLSDDAQINAKPELEIYADDVKCSHGSTTGQLDENALFYLQARGISKANARKLLVSAFIGEVIEAIDNEDVTELVYNLLKKEHGWDF